MTGRGEDLPTRDERVECFPWVICVGREGRKMGNRFSAGGDRDVFAAFRPGHKAGQKRVRACTQSRLMWFGANY